MPHRVRVADRFKKQSAEQLVTMAGAIVTGLSGNAAFPAPTVDLKAVQTAADDLNAALVAQAQGGPAATAEKNDKREALMILLRKLKHYVEDNCGNDLAVLLSSGFQAAASTRNREYRRAGAELTGLVARQNLVRGPSVECVDSPEPDPSLKCAVSESSGLSRHYSQSVPKATIRDHAN